MARQRLHTPWEVCHFLEYNMKKILLALAVLAITGTANAQWHHHGYYRGYGCGGCWVAPAVIGGVIGYELSHPAPVIVQQPPVIVQQQPVIVNPEIRYIDGIAYRVQIMNINGINQEVLVKQ